MVTNYHLLLLSKNCIMLWLRYSKKKLFLNERCRFDCVLKLQNALQNNIADHCWNVRK